MWTESPHRQKIFPPTRQFDKMRQTGPSVGLPGGRPVEHKIEKPVQIGDRPVGAQAQFLWWLAEAVHPDGRITERLRAGCIPSPESGEDDVLLCDVKPVHAQLIRAGIAYV